MNLNKYLYWVLSASVVTCSYSAWAAAPVENIGAGSAPVSVYSTPTQEATVYPAGEQPSSFASPSPQAPSNINLSDNQRLTRVEHQVSNLQSMNLPQQMSDLQQQMQQLSGQLEELQHQLKTLSDQQASYYQDLDQRLNQLKASAPVSAGPSKLGAPLSANAKLKESDEYQAAVNMLMKKDYAKAGPAFKAYISHYPQASYTANAYYWLGEANLMTKKLSDAGKAFQTVISKYPKSDKVADARLKLAMVHAQQASVPMAKAELKKIKTDYPGSTIAQLATIQLQQLESGSLNSN